MGNLNCCHKPAGDLSHRHDQVYALLNPRYQGCSQSSHFDVLQWPDAEEKGGACITSSTSSSAQTHKDVEVESSGCRALCHRDDSQRRCESCAKVPDTNHWVLVEPDISVGNDVSTYSLSSPTGSYECSETGLRWSCAGPVTLQYYDLQWELYCEEMANTHYKPAGPLMDIRLMSGELEEIHLPHFLCLGDCEASLHDAVRVLHGQNSGVCLEVCELTRHHAKLTHPSLSPLGLLLKTGIRIRVHCELLLYKTITSPLTLHAYLVPKEQAALRAVEDQERSSGVKISKPKPERSLWMKNWFSMRTSCPSFISPEEIKLRYCSFSPNFFEVYFKHAAEAFEMELVCVSTSKSVWRAEIRRNDYSQTSWKDRAILEEQNNDQCQTSGNYRDTSEEGKSDICTGGSTHITEIKRDDHYPTRGIDRNISDAAAFVDRHRAELIGRVYNVMPFADALLSKGLVHPEKYSEIRAAATSEAKMREIYECLRSAGAEGKAAFYGVLLQEEPHLLQDLSTPAL
ncbi:NACHT, LRR and PYD domains-containing protein 1 homolog [Alosa pseudoharengus]|uniref:NACHT, LRR and PYD domains-containing protein 1 homolog n=1 Tax=Alosa pseudoharengus TaxID=34774 RepID=UPI003F8B88BB